MSTKHICPECNKISNMTLGNGQGTMNHITHELSCSKVIGMTPVDNIPPDFLKGQTVITRNTTLSPKLITCANPINSVELAFTIQDPCGNTAIVLAREVLRLISNREDDGICQSLIHEIQQLNKLYPR